MFYLMFLFRKDWGALILVDARYAKGAYYTKGMYRKCVCVHMRACVCVTGDTG